MSVKRQTIAYGLIAAILAVSLIAGTIFVNPTLNTSKPTGGNTSTSSLSSTGTSSGGGTTPFLVMMTDPPVVPNGTTALNLTYSDIEIHVKLSESKSDWVSSNTSGTVDLLSLINVTKTLAVAHIQNGSIVDQIRFDVGSVKIAINGTVYNVTSTNAKLTVPIGDEKSVVELSGALVDFNPRVVEIVTANASAPVFVLIPSATAVIRYGTQISSNQTQIGHEEHLSKGDRQAIDESSHGNVTITSASLVVSGNSTTLSITVKNTGNSSVALAGLSLEGPFNATIGSVSICPSINVTQKGQGDHTGTHDVNVSTSVSENNTESESVDQGANLTISENMTISGSRSDGTTAIPSSASSTTITSTTTTTENTTTTTGSQTAGNTSGPSDAEFFCGVMHTEFEHPHALVFATSSNSTILTPVLFQDNEHENSPLILQANQSVTLTYSGVISLHSGGGDGEAPSVSIAVFPFQNETYTISLALSGDSQSSVQVVST